jgi:hypothetical protein
VRRFGETGCLHEASGLPPVVNEKLLDYSTLREDLRMSERLPA